MNYYVTQYGDSMFVIRKVKGYSTPLIFNGTQISAKEYEKLYHSSEKREILVSPKRDNGQFVDIRMPGNANKILGKEIKKIG